MANKIITALPIDSTDPNVRAADWVAVSRGGVTYKAAFSGTHIVPSTTAADAKKAFMVDESGNPEWRRILRSDFYRAQAAATTIWSTGLIVTSASQVGTLDANQLFADYDDLAFTIHCRGGAGGSDTHRLTMPAGSFTVSEWHTMQALNHDLVVAIRKYGAADNQFEVRMNDRTTGPVDARVVQVTHVTGWKRI